MPVNVGSRDFRHPNVISYDGTNLASNSPAALAAGRAFDLEVVFFTAELPSRRHPPAPPSRHVRGWPQDRPFLSCIIARVGPDATSPRETCRCRVARNPNC